MGGSGNRERAYHAGNLPRGVGVGETDGNELLAEFEAAVWDDVRNADMRARVKPTS